MDDIKRMTLAEALAGLRAKRFSSVELTQALLGVMEPSQKDIHAFVTIDAEGALRAAAEADRRRAAGTRSQRMCTTHS